MEMPKHRYNLGSVAERTEETELEKQAKVDKRGKKKRQKAYLRLRENLSIPKELLNEKQQETKG